MWPRLPAGGADRPTGGVAPALGTQIAGGPSHQAMDVAVAAAQYYFLLAAVGSHLPPEQRQGVRASIDVDHAAAQLGMLMGYHSHQPDQGRLGKLGIACAWRSGLRVAGHV